MIRVSQRLVVTIMIMYNIMIRVSQRLVVTIMITHNITITSKDSFYNLYVIS